MGDILQGTEDFDVVRGLIHLDVAFMTDLLMGSFAFLDFVEALVKDNITDWATLMAGGGSDMIYLKTGTACLLAIGISGSRLRGSASYGVGFRIDEYSETRPGGAAIAWDDVIADLKMKAEAAFSSISTFIRSRRKLVVMSGPTRAKTNVPLTWEAWLEKIVPPIIDWLEEDGEDDPIRP